MVWRDGIMGCLPVRLPDEVRAAVTDHRDWLRARSRRDVSLAEAVRDLVERGLGTCRRFHGRTFGAQLSLALEEERIEEERRRHG